MTDYALEVKNLYTNVGDFSLTDVNLSLEKGTITGFIGKNGSGKTTFIKTILDLLPRAKGKILFFGNPIEGNEADIKSRLGVVFDNLIYSQALKPKTIMKTISPFYPTFDEDYYNGLMKRFDLNPDKRLKHYSKGMQMKFSIIMALAHKPDLLILDEPTAGLDPVARAEVLDLLYDIIQSEEKTIFFSTHITSDLDKIADYITMIDNGKIVFTSAKDEMLESHCLVHIDKKNMTDEIKSLFVGLKETTFGYEGIIADKSKLSLIPNAKVAKPTVEDIMVYRSGLK
jgi:ABC-2 type transport system ATP-binding protein